MLFAERVEILIPSSTNCAGVGYIRDIVILKIKGKRIASLHVRHRRGLSRHIIKWLVSCNFRNVGYLSETISAKGGAADNFITKVSKFRDLVPLLITTVLLLGTKDRLCFAYVCNAIWKWDLAS